MLQNICSVKWTAAKTTQTLFYLSPHSKNEVRMYHQVENILSKFIRKITEVSPSEFNELWIC